jgi:hypothetical protein
VTNAFFFSCDARKLAVWREAFWYVAQANYLFGNFPDLVSRGGRLSVERGGEVRKAQCENCAA